MGIFDKLFKGPSLQDPVRGTAQVVSASGYRGDGVYQNGHLELVIQAEGIPATAVQFQGLMHRNKWPVPGMVLPVSIDRADPSRFRIEWDKVQSGRDRGQQAAEAIAAAMRGEGAGGPTPMPGFPAGATAQVVNLSGRDLSQLSEEQKAKLRMLGIDPDALASAQGQSPPPTGAAPGAPPPAAPPPPAPVTPSQPAPQAGGQGVDDRVALLERLAKLREQGVLTDEEFQAQKKQILGN